MNKESNSQLILYSYFRSSAAYRVRIALNIKAVNYKIQPIHLLQSGGEQHHQEFHAINPQELVPVLRHKSTDICQSLAIMEYLEAIFPEPSLLPNDFSDSIACREFSLSICCDIHPLNNLRVLNALKNYELSEQEIHQWYRHWIKEGFSALEERLTTNSSIPIMQYCFGNTATMADACLVPQIYNALRYKVDMSKYPTLNAIYQHCLMQPEFIQAAPEQQPDFPDH